MAGGRPTEYSEELLQKALEYISDDAEKNYKKHEHAIPSLVGLCRVLKLGKTTLYNWADENSDVYHEEFRDILEALNDFQHLALTNGGLTGSFNSTIAKLILHKHGHSDKSETDLTSGGETIKNDWHIHPVTTDKNGKD